MANHGAIDSVQITPIHSRAARLLLEWDQSDLVRRAQVSIATVRRFEGGHAVSDDVKQKIRNAFEGAGLIFFFSGDARGKTVLEIGVLLRKKKKNSRRS